jgi:hypothetical protein
MIMTRINGRDYPLKSVPSCKTCQSPHRLYIENALLQGRSYRNIARSLPDETKDGNPSSEGIRNHYTQEHMPLNQAIQRGIIENRAKQIGRNIEEEVDEQVDKILVAEMVIHKGWEMLQTNAAQPTVAETLSAIKLLNELEKSSETDVDNETWVATMQVMMETAHALMTNEQWEKFGRQLASNPILRAIANKEANTVEGELEA